MRLAYAARTLLEQVGCTHEPLQEGQNGPCGVVGDPDGYGVHRTVMVPPEVAQRVSGDPRVLEVAVVSTALGEVGLVKFRSNRLGDLTQPFET